MSSPIDLVPYLYHVPSSSHFKFKTSTPTPPQTQTPRKAEDTIDIFSTLFSPATPRPSPTLTPITIFPVNNSTNARPIPHSYQQYSEPKSADSDFGSFVSVPATEDPLSILSSLPSPGLSLPHPIQPAHLPSRPQASQKLKEKAAPKMPA